MDWINRYKSRVVDANEAVQAIKSGNRIFMTGNVSVPQKLLAALVEYAPQLKDVEICQALSVGPADYVSLEMEGHLRVNTLFISANVRKAVQEGRADFTPVLLSEFPLLFKNKILPVDVALIHVSPPDEHGFCSLGVEVGLTKSPAEISKDRHCRSQRTNAAHAGQFVYSLQPLGLYGAGELSSRRTTYGRWRR